MKSKAGIFACTKKEIFMAAKILVSDFSVSQATVASFKAKNQFNSSRLSSIIQLIAFAVLGRMSYVYSRASFSRSTILLSGITALLFGKMTSTFYHCMKNYRAKSETEKELDYQTKIRNELPRFYEQQGITSQKFNQPFPIEQRTNDSSWAPSINYNTFRNFILKIETAINQKIAQYPDQAVSQLRNVQIVATNIADEQLMLPYLQQKGLIFAFRQVGSKWEIQA
jgi:hypothetical protein